MHDSPAAERVGTAFIESETPLVPQFKCHIHLLLGKCVGRVERL